MNEKIREGQEAPDFCLPDQNGREICMRNMKGRWTVLYFYPKDNTPGCSSEAVGFSEHKEDFRKRNTEIVGVSRDSLKSHRNFIEKKNLNIELLSDPQAVVHKKYGVWRPKRFMGREFLGTIRSTFLINPEGMIAKVWDDVKVSGHAREVLDTIASSEAIRNN